MAQVIGQPLYCMRSIFTRDRLSSQSFSSQMDRKTSVPFINARDLEHIHDRLAINMKQNVESQAELLKSLEQYKAACEQMAKASDAVAQVVGKLAISTMDVYNLNKEFRPVDDETEAKQKNLNMALAQITRFHAAISKQNSLIASSLSSDFDRPIHSNMERYREIVHSWEKEFEKDTKKLEHEVKHMESKATRAGRMHTKDMSKLSISLLELSSKISELKNFKQDRIAEAFMTDQHQYLFVAHHLQRVFKTELYAYRTMYYDGTAYPKKEVADSISDRRNVNLTPIRTQSHDSERAALLESAPQTAPPRETILPNEPIISPQPPVRRSSLDDPAPEDRRDSFNRAASPIPPAIPENPHRRTVVFPKASSPRTLDIVHRSNFPDTPDGLEAVMTPSTMPSTSAGSVQPEQGHILPRHGDPLNRRSNSRSRHHQDEVLSHYFGVTDSPSWPNSGNFDQDDTFSLVENELVVVIYEYEGQEVDDLNVGEGDVVRVISVEGEWVYGMLLVPSLYDEQEFAPMMEHGVPKCGWLPLTFVDRLDPLE